MTKFLKDGEIERPRSRCKVPKEESKVVQRGYEDEYRTRNAGNGYSKKNAAKKRRSNNSRPK